MKAFLDGLGKRLVDKTYRPQPLHLHHGTGCVGPMGYEFDVDVGSLLAERYPQFVNLGIAAADLDRVRPRITTMWADAPGGWTYELSALADGYAGRGEHYLASLAYGLAKFPVLANGARRRALRRQLEEYLLASSGFQGPLRAARPPGALPGRHCGGPSAPALPGGAPGGPGAPL